MDKEKAVKCIFIGGILLCCFPWMDAAYALLLGTFLSLTAGNPWLRGTAVASKNLLKMAVIGLGFGISLEAVFTTGKASIIYTLVGICMTLLMGAWLGRLLRVEGNTSTLISFGTAICGGSAIAAMAPVIKARDGEVAVSLAIIFTLNAVALLLFPALGHFFHLSQETFGTWAGMAIHDTSSVVGAASVYGDKALAIGTTVKLTRAFWITPFVLGQAWRTNECQKSSFPWFIAGFVLAAVVSTLLPAFAKEWQGLAALARQGLVITLFLVGAGLSRERLRTIGIRPLLQAVILWLLIGTLTLICLKLFGLY